MPSTPAGLGGRVHLCAGQDRRAFHAASLLNQTVDATVDLITQLHVATHTPWYVTLPLLAVGVNLMVRLPFSLHSRRLAQKRQRLGPVLEAWAAAHMRAAHQAERKQRQDRRLQGLPAADRAAADIQAAAMKAFGATTKRLYRTFGVQTWKLYGSILALPPWLLVIEAIRQLCGSPVGLLGLLLRRDSSQAAAAAAAAADDGSALAGTAATVGGTADLSLSSGGCLWFPDLAAADPYGVLPFALSAVMVVNVLPSTDAGRRALFGLGPAPGRSAETVLQPVAMRGLQRTLLLMSVSVGFVTLHFPSAIHLYWLSSACTSFAITRLLRVRPSQPRTAVRLGQKLNLPWITPRRPLSDAASR